MATPEPSLPAKYRPADHEQGVRAAWDAAHAFHADPDRVLSGEKPPYSIFIPPPNVTARLHLGHALNNTLQDVLARVHRMRGYEVLWMPGTDHAGIATQTVVEQRILKEEGKRRTDFTREEFIARVQAWKDEYEQAITDQLKAIGCSCDWERQRFTMDEICARAVREAFFILFRDGLIYRGKRLVNWDPASQTALADDEVEMEEIDGFFYYLRYPLVHRVEGEDAQPASWSELARRGYPGAESYPPEEQAWITVATTRPETYLGDTAVAINPKDPRAAALEGLFCELPLVGRVIPIVKDDYVVMPAKDSEDPKAKYATGFLKVTPAHDPNDYDIGRRHNLPVINVMAPDASISDKHGWTVVGDARLFVGLSREAARDKVLQEFKSRGLLEKQLPYRHAVGHSYRSHVPIEPYLSDQWYCKVTDHRLRGSALRAMAPEQRSSSPASSSPPTTSSGTGVPPVSTSSSSSSSPPPSPTSAGIPQSLTIHHRNLPHWELGGRTYFITFRLKDGQLTESERRTVLDACAHWHNERAVVHLITVMPDHVHLLLTPMQKAEGVWHPLEELMHSVKSFTAHSIQKARGRSGPLWQDEYFDRLVRDEEEFSQKWLYMVNNPVEAKLVQQPQEYRHTYSPQCHDLEPEGRWSGRASREPGKKSGKQEGGEEVEHGRDARATRVGRGGREDKEKSKANADGDGALTFFPDRYAKMYESWHENLRDWCISRQLWWGHRIPVWSGNVAAIDSKYPFNLESRTFGAPFLHSIEGVTVAIVLFPVANGCHCFVCAPSTHPAIESLLNDPYLGLTQDPDVLDTWFSSALWPISTLGWPEPPQNMKGLLEAFNPSAVLCTAREIITLWVSRMVMFNRYFLSSSSAPSTPSSGTGVPPVSPAFSTPSSSPAFTPGPVPFREVYINPVVQDGHGQRMSKSLGNGVDPLDIVHSHGTDAMRLVLCQIATGTQDVKMPVDLSCPHCEHAFEPAWMTSPTGHKVASPNQTCPSCKKRMVSAFGVATGSVKPSAEAPLARNSSTRFDAGRNFCTKLWNATRFAMMNLEGADSSPASAPSSGTGVPPVPPASPPSSPLSLPDRWMLSRLARTIGQVDAALAEYQFSRYAELMYDLFWRDFCDWYLEAIKPTVKASGDQQSVLRCTLDTILRLLHPITPFVTEVLHGALRPIVRGVVPGLTLRDSELLCLAGWPAADPLLIDDEAEREFARLQSLVDQVRQVRAAKGVEPRRKVTLHADAETARAVAGWAGIVESLAGVERVTPEPAGPADAPFLFEGRPCALSNLVDASDPAQERERLTDALSKLDKDISVIEARLNNPGYTAKAPPHLVAETRESLSKKQAERESLRIRLAGGG